MMVRALIFLLSLLLGLTKASYLLVSRLGKEHLLEGGSVFFLGTGAVKPWYWVDWFYVNGSLFPHLVKETIWPIYAGVIAGILLAWMSRLLKSAKERSTAHGSSRWAFDKEIYQAELLAKHGVVLGQTAKKKIIRHDGPEHILAIAPTRGGKGVGLVIPTLLEWQHSAVIFDPKGENWQKTSGYRNTIGSCLKFDPTTLRTTRFNPLMEIRKGSLEVKDAQNIADIVVDPDGRLETRNHWQNSAHSLLVGSILHVLYARRRKSLTGVLELLTSKEQSLKAFLEEMKNSEHLVVQSVAQEMLNKHIEELSGVVSTATSMLSVFRDPLVATATDEHDFFIKDMQQKVTSLYLVLPPSDLSRLRVLIRLMLNQMGRVLTEQQQESSKQVLFLLDEFPALGRLEFFESALAYMAGYGLKAFLICQSLNQLQKAYGDKNSILDNCHVRVAFANNDEQTAKRLSEMLGEQTLKKEQTSVSGARFAMLKRNASISLVEYGRALLLPSEIGRLPADKEIILVNGNYPILAHKLKYYQDARYQHKLLTPVIIKQAQNNPTNMTINSPKPQVICANAFGSAL